MKDCCKQTLDHIIELAGKTFNDASSKVEGGGNGRRIIIQALSSLTSQLQELKKTMCCACRLPKPKGALEVICLNDCYCHQPEVEKGCNCPTGYISKDCPHFDGHIKKLINK